MYQVNCQHWGGAAEKVSLLYESIRFQTKKGVPGDSPISGRFKTLASPKIESSRKWF